MNLYDALLIAVPLAGILLMLGFTADACSPPVSRNQERSNGQEGTKSN